MKYLAIPAVLICVLLSACVREPLVEPAPVIILASPTPTPSVFEFVGRETFVGEAGIYIVDCNDCMASVTTNIPCFDEKAGVEVKPPVLVVLDDVSKRDSTVSTDKPKGKWIIENQTILVPELNERGTGYEGKECISRAEFKVVMQQGGIINKLPQ